MYKRKRSSSAPGSSKRYRSSVVRRRRYVRARYPYRRRVYRRRRYGLGIRSPRIPKTLRVKNPALANSTYTSFTYKGYRSHNVAAGTGGTWSRICLNSLATGAPGTFPYTPEWTFEADPEVSRYFNDKDYTQFRVISTEVEITLRGSSEELDTFAVFYKTNDPNVTPGILQRDDAWLQSNVSNWTVKPIEDRGAGAGLSVIKYRGHFRSSTAFGVPQYAIKSDDQYFGRVVAGSPGGGSLQVENPEKLYWLYIGTFFHPLTQLPGSAAEIKAECTLRYHVKLESNQFEPRRSEVITFNP